MDSCTIIGVDCATSPKDVGLARGIWQKGKLRIHEVTNGQFQAPDEAIAQWIPESGHCLLAMDAPLGWPRDFGRTLAKHIAGTPLQGEPNQLFRRETDHFVQRTYGKAPLDVGADRIARTALSALQLLDALATKTSAAIPLAWDTKFVGVAAIEVYPAGTLRASGVPSSAYKKPEQVEPREQILAWLANEAALPEDLALPLADADALDSMICVVAGADFLAERTNPPSNLALAQKEGWIWIRKGV